MDSDVFRRNLSVLDIHTATAVRNATNLDTLSFRHAKTGYTVPVLSRDGKDRPLHSLVAPEREAVRNLHLTSLQDRPAYIVACGMGAGHHLTSLLEHSNLTYLLLVVPNISLFRSVIEDIDLTRILGDDRTHVVTRGTREHIERKLSSTYHPAIYGNLHVIGLRSIGQLYPVEYGAAMDSIQQASDRVRMDFATQARFGLRWMRNALFNLPFVPNTCNLPPPPEKAAVIAAGPTLEDSIDQIRSYESPEHAIIATDTSFPALLGAGITPDITVTIDSQVISCNHYRNTPDLRIVSMLALTTSPAVTRRVPNPCFISTQHPFSRYVSNHPGGPTRIDASGGNVTYAALNIARELGATTISLYGADFSYPNGKAYARGTYVYPYIHCRTGRTRPSLTQSLDLIYRNKTTRIPSPDGNLTYCTELMSYYQKAVSSLLMQPAGQRGFNGTTESFDWRAVLSKYAASVSTIDLHRMLRPHYFASLKTHKKEIAITLLPQVLAVLQDAEPTPDSFMHVRDATLADIEWILAHF